MTSELFNRLLGLYPTKADVNTVEAGYDHLVLGHSINGAARENGVDPGVLHRFIQRRLKLAERIRIN